MMPNVFVRNRDGRDDKARRRPLPFITLTRSPPACRESLAFVPSIFLMNDQRPPIQNETIPHEVDMHEVDPADAVDPAEIQRAMDELRTDQNLIGGTTAGFVGAVVGAAAWAGVTIASGIQIGWMAVGIGFLVGYAVRTVGKGVDPIFGYVGAALSLLGCFAGNLMALIGIYAQWKGVPILDFAAQQDVASLTKMLVDSFSPIDLLFYGIAVYEGYRLSFRQLTEADAEALMGS